jgi:Na+/melibiose symporter-like transporter
VKKFGKKHTSIITVSAGILLSVAAFFAGYSNLILTIVIHALFSFFTYIPMVIFTTIFADSVIYAEWKHGTRADGTIFAFRTLNGKFANALAPFIIGLLLVSYGYAQNGPQTQTALNGLHFIITVIPAIILALCIIPLFFYNLTQEKITKMSEVIKRDDLSE